MVKDARIKTKKKIAIVEKLLPNVKSSLLNTITLPFVN